jgi:uncharacterized membrane protein
MNVVKQYRTASSILLLICCTSRIANATAPLADRIKVRLADEHGRDVIGAEVSATIHLPIEQVTAAVTDVANYPKWISAVRSVQASGEAHTFVWELPWPLGTVKQTLDFTREPIDGQISLAWEQLDGDMTAHDGYWLLAADGANRTTVTYHVAVAFKSWVPDFLIASAERRSLPLLMQKLAEYAATLPLQPRLSAR